MFAENVPMKKGSGFKIESISWLERIPRAIGAVMAFINYSRFKTKNLFELGSGKILTVRILAIFVFVTSE